jgi:hypothetical protein
MKPGDPDFLAVWLIAQVVIGGGIGLLIGRAKGRPGLGFLLGFLLGIIGWIISAIIPRPALVTREQKPSRGWYPDPTGAHQLRYFDGNRWLDDVADNGTMTSDPIQNVPAHIVRVAEMQMAPPPPPPAPAPAPR